MNRDLFLAILSLDSYNRGYGVNIQGLAVPEFNPDGSKRANVRLGMADLSYDSVALLGPNAEAAGFYAIAYELPPGYIEDLSGTVISYRGTNFNINWNPFTFLNSPVIKDAVSGWSVGAGLAGQQAALALDFYLAIAPDEVDPRSANILSTGHSLGGGLGGFVANVFRQQAVLFDHMPYTPLSSSLRAYFDAQRFFGGEGIWEFSDRGISALSTAEELLSPLRLLNSEDYTPLESYSEFSDPLKPVKLHSMSLLVSLLWARDFAGSAWHATGEELWNGFFDEALAISLPGISDRVGPGGSEQAVFQSAIAYSALPVGQGELPFGDTAIWSMFDDAADLGGVLAGSEPAFYDQMVYRTPSLFNPLSSVDVKQHLANLLVQYAGALALYDVEQANGESISVEGGSVDARKGILSAKEADSALAIDLSRQMWGDVLKSGTDDAGRPILTADRVNPIEREALLEVFLKQASDDGFFSRIGKLLGLRGASSWDTDSLAKLAERVWGTSDLAIFDRLHIARTNDPATVTLDGRGYQSDISDGVRAQVDLYVGSGADETITNKTEGHSVIITGSGADVVHAGKGRDVLVSTGGGDKLYGDDGNDIIFAINGENAITSGGPGRDIIVNEAKGGIIWGDIENSVLQADGTRLAFIEGQRFTILDDSTNADLFQFAPDTVIMDAQFYDKIRYHGITLTGGDAAASSLGFALGLVVGGGTKNVGLGMTTASAFIGAANLTATLIDNRVYYDNLLPFITYKREGDDLLIGNLITAFLAGIGDAFGVDDTSSGVMVVKDYFKGGGGFNATIWGTQQFIDSVNGRESDIPINKLNLAFKDPNPLLAVAQLLSLLPPIAGSTVLANVYKAFALADSALGLAAALVRDAKAAEWIEGSDPLIIDLDGDGIETLDVWSENIYFDIDNDLFAERTGWLKGDDGFLVLDANGNGRIDDNWTPRRTGCFRPDGGAKGLIAVLGA